VEANCGRSGGDFGTGCLVVMLARRLRKLMPMRFALEIGESEKNRLEFQFNQLLGSTVIKVNNHEVKKTVRYFSEPLLERHVVEVGKDERHTVFIEKHRKLLFGQKYMVYVNERLVKLLHGV